MVVGFEPTTLDWISNELPVTPSMLHIIKLFNKINLLNNKNNSYNVFSISFAKLISLKLNCSSYFIFAHSNSL